MAWIDKYLSGDEIKNIEAAISKAEENTSGEIVPVIVKRSSAVGHVPLLLTLALTLLIVIAELPWSQWLWVAPWVYLWPLLIILIYFVAYFVAKSFWVQKVFVPEGDEMKQVHHRAQLEFFLNKIQRTKGNTGILLFVSVMEKKAVVLGDEGISKVLPQETWDLLLGELRPHLNRGEWSTGFIKAIEMCGRHLKTHFPIEGHIENELKNQLIIKD